MSNKHTLLVSEDPNSCSSGVSCGTKATQIKTHWRIQKFTNVGEGRYVSKWTQRKRAKRERIGK